MSEVAGSSPARATQNYAFVAQWSEQFTLNEKVEGSNPSERTKTYQTRLERKIDAITNN